MMIFRRRTYTLRYRNRRVPFRTILTIFTFFLACTIRAQTDTISLQEAIGLAWKNNASLKLAQLQYQESQHHTSEVRGLRYPPLLFRTHYLYAPLPGYNEIVTNNGEYGLQFTTSIPLYDGGARSGLVDQSVTLEDRSLVSVEKSRVEVGYSIRSIYYDILRARGELTIREKTIDRLQNYLSLLRQLRLGGNATESDLLKATVDLDNAQVELDRTRQDLEKGKKLLVNVLGIPLDRRIEVRADALPDSAALPAFDIENSPDILLLAHDKKFAEQDLRIAQADRLPVLTVSGDIGALGVKPYQFHQDIGYSILLSLDIPLFTWGALDNRIEQKELEIEKTDAQLEIQRRELETEWRTAVDNLGAVRKNLNDYGNTITLAEQNYLSAKARFAGGTATSLEVLDAQRSLVETQLNFNKTLFDLRVLLAGILRLSGKE